MAGNISTSLFSRKLFMGATVGAALFFMVLGVIFWGGFNTAMEVTNTLEFCITCHEMEDNVYKEYKQTIHYNNRAGVRATCSDCHVPRPWVHKVVRKIQASNEVLHKILGSIDTPEKFDAKRLKLASNVWRTMKKTDSRECRNCHDFKTMDPERQKPRSRKQHMNAMENGNTCIDCHKGIAHKKVHDQLSEEEMDKLVAPDPKLAIELPEQWQAFLAKEAAEKEAKKAAAQAEREARAAAAAKSAAAAPAAAGGGMMDWGDVPSMTATLFYPGQGSMEWVLRGKDHGGARPFKAGDRCFDCHAQEAADMGQKMVSGEKIEPNPIPGKRGHIPVTIQAAHDGDNLYMRFSWPEGEHSPAPGVDGGKMDPDNPMKLALMLSTDEVEYADRAGCWGTCHADANTMPFAPEGQNVTKYLKESRTKIETRGRGGKPLGGWDKRKADDEIKAELEAGRFMDLIRYKSGKGEVEDGYILADRVMEGGQGAEFSARQEGGNWVVEMKRKLSSDKVGDVSLATGQTYNIGFAIHDDYTSARYHHVSVGYKLGFDNEEAEINAVKRQATGGGAAAPAAAKAAAPKAAAAPAGGMSVDWSRASEMQATLFYPGQGSMEWVLRGKDHGGARPFKAGDRCFDCHAQEAADMGQKMVSGEKIEPNPIPGKRGHIPVTIQAAHDGDNLYMRFSWPEGEHSPAPGVDGGKMDPDNPMKLALMLSTDEVEYADRAGCWGTCHADANTMPFAPEGQNVTKYLKESRTKIETRGRGGKPLGGWDKRKADDEIKAELEAGRFMDLIRYKSGKGEVEDGYILADRVMEGGQGAEFSARQEGGNWVVEMKRKLSSDKVGDVSLATGQTYNIGFAIHDDYTSARYHHVSVGYKLGFDNEEAEINALKQ